MEREGLQRIVLRSSAKTDDLSAGAPRGFGCWPPTATGRGIARTASVAHLQNARLAPSSRQSWTIEKSPKMRMRAGAHLSRMSPTQMLLSASRRERRGDGAIARSEEPGGGARELGRGLL
jgi:hypothetical protein